MGVLSAAAAIRKLSHTGLPLVSQPFEPCGRRCSVRLHTVRRPRLALGDGAATRVGYMWTHLPILGNRRAFAASLCLCAGSACAQAGTAVGLKRTPPCSVFKTPFHGVDVFVSVCVRLLCLLCVAVCSTSLVSAVRSVSKTLARELDRKGTVESLSEARVTPPMTGMRHSHLAREILYLEFGVTLMLSACVFHVFCSSL